MCPSGSRHPLCVLQEGLNHWEILQKPRFHCEMEMVRGTGFEPVTPTVSRAAPCADLWAVLHLSKPGAGLGAGRRGSRGRFPGAHRVLGGGVERDQRAGLTGAAQRARTSAGFDAGDEHAGAEQGHPNQGGGRPKGRADDKREEAQPKQSDGGDGSAVGRPRPSRGVAARADVRGDAVDGLRWRRGRVRGWLGLGWWLGRSGRWVTPVVAAGAALGEKGVGTGVLSGQTTRTGNGSGCFHQSLRFEVTGCTTSDTKRPKKKNLTR